MNVRALAVIRCLFATTLALAATTILFAALFAWAKTTVASPDTSPPSLCPTPKLYARGFHTQDVDVKYRQCLLSRSTGTFYPPAALGDSSATYAELCNSTVAANDAFWVDHQDDYMRFLNTKERVPHVHTLDATNSMQIFCLNTVSKAMVTDMLGFGSCVQYFSAIAAVRGNDLTTCTESDLLEACQTIESWFDVGLRIDYCQRMPLAA